MYTYKRTLQVVQSYTAVGVLSKYIHTSDAWYVGIQASAVRLCTHKVNSSSQFGVAVFFRTSVLMLPF